MIFNTIRREADTIILVTAAILIVAGLAVLSSASSNMSMRLFGEPYFFLKRQAALAGFGTLGLLAGLFVPLKFLRKYAYILLGISVVGLVLVFTPLAGDFGTANRWIEIAGFPFQPSELLKITFIVAMAAWLTERRKDRKGDFKEGFGQFMLGAGVISALLYLQPATSIILIVMGAACVMYFIHGLKPIYIAGIMLAGAAFAGLFFFSDYRSQRIAVFRNPEADIRGAGFHINQALTTIGSGGLFGVGYGKSTLKLSLPEPANDSIFAILAEEFGFVGSIFFIGLYLVLVISGLLGAQEAKNEFGRLSAIGFASIFGIQSAMHIASISNLIPMMGVPLPFISYGGTSLVVAMTTIGLMVNIFRNA